MTRVEKLRLKREACGTPAVLRNRKRGAKQMLGAKTKQKRRKERKPYKIVEGKGHISLECWKRLRELE